jgi:hypothetical protein
MQLKTDSFRLCGDVRPVDDKSYGFITSGLGLMKPKYTQSLSANVRMMSAQVVEDVLALNSDPAWFPLLADTENHVNIGMPS